MNDEVEKKLDQLIKCQTQNDHSFRDSCITKQQFLNYLSRREESHNQQIALAARIDELKNIPVDVHKVHRSHMNFCMRIGYRNGRIRELEATLKQSQQGGE